jgi:Zn-dependent M16 (insulinase) family peptidase
MTPSDFMFVILSRRVTSNEHLNPLRLYALTPLSLEPMRLLLALLLSAATAYAAPVQLDSLKKGQTVEGFRVDSLYLNDAGKPIGGRFIHARSGFTLDYLQIESVPQGYTWVNSIPVGDQGEPHTQEHLLLGKGTTGRAFAGLDTMWLSSSTAFTQQWRTSYHFNTSAGKDVFFDLFAAELNALLHPNYTDEEIRREVRSFGVTENPDKTLRLEEKGSVYNEMTSSSANPFRVLFRETGHLIYGKSHPLAYNSGGEPSGIRTMKPEDIRNFHAANYYLANMGTLVAFPKSVTLEEVLDRTDAILNKVESEPSKRPSTTAKPFPAPQAAAPGTIAIGDYPHRNDQQPSPIAFAWPATRNDLSAEEVILLELFAETFAGDATTNLYKLFVDSKTRVMDTGATAVFGNVDRDPGHAVAVILQNVAANNITTEKLAEIRQKITGELARVASLPDGSAELKEFNKRVLSRVSETERQLANFVNTPPSWGARGTGSGWMDQLLLLERTGDFKKSVTLAPQLSNIRKLLGSDKNLWREKLAQWQLTSVTPYAIGVRPSPALLQREETERVARAEAETLRLANQYSTRDLQAALQRYQKEQDAAALLIEDEAKKLTPPAFVKNPPMSLDEQLQYKQTKLGSGVPIVTSTFDNMSSATVAMVLRADYPQGEQLRYLSLLPALLTRVGVIENGKPVSYEEMSERLRTEVLNLNAYFSTNPRTERVELVVRGSGLGATEAKRAIEWISLVLHHPDWRVENLARIRDVVDQTLSGLRNTMQGSEESWVNNPANAYRMQHHQAFLATDSFLTRSHNALRLRWLLKDAPAAADREALDRWFAQLAEQKGTRAELKAMMAKPETVAGLSTEATAIAKEVLKDLDLTLIEIPDSTLAADWTYLVNAIRADLNTPPATTLASIDALRKRLLNRLDARMWLVSSTELQKAIASSVESLSASLGDLKVSTTSARTQPLVDGRVAARGGSDAKPVYVGLLAPNMKGGVIITSVPAVHYSDFDQRDKQLDYLAGRLHAGYGAHGIFLKTLAAGLAYSNGLRGTVAAGRTGYYAERTPEIPQTVKFVIDVLKTAPRDARLSDYAIAQVFGESRAAANYENRAEQMASDLADGQPPEQVRKFRTSILELRKDPKLGDLLFDRKDAVYGRALPGYNVKGKDVPGAIYFTIGPDKQLDAWEAHLKNAEGAETKLIRLYPRDFWMP